MPSNMQNMLPTADNGMRILRLKLATITARLASLNKIIKKKNFNLAEIMTYLTQLKHDASEIEKKMGTKRKKKCENLIQSYKSGLVTTQFLLQDAII